MNLGKLIGLVAISRSGISYTHQKCLIVFGASRRTDLEKHLEASKLSHLTIKKAYSDEILKVLTSGLGGYAFDPESFERFTPIAAAQGIKVPQDIVTNNPKQLIIVEPPAP